MRTLMNDGTQLLGVKLIDRGKPPMELPIEVFDGSAFEEPLGRLPLEWKRILAGQ